MISIALPLFQKARGVANPLVAVLRRLARVFLNERDRWILWTPVFVGLGIGIYFSFPVEPPQWAAMTAIVVPSLVSAVALVLPIQYRTWVMVFGLALVLVALGFSASQLRTSTLEGRALSERIGPVWVQGRVIKVETFESGLRVMLDQLRLPNLAKNATPDRVRVRLRGEQPMIEPGARLAVRAVLSPPPEPSAPGAFDFQRHAYFQGLGGVGFGLGQADIVENSTWAGSSQGAFALAVQAVRHRVAANVRADVGGTAGSVIVALLTGERTEIKDRVMQSIRDSGLAHLLAISGLHIGLVAAFVFGVVRAGLALIPAVALRYPIKKWAAVVAFFAAGGYTLLAGATVPSQRAFLMLSLVLFAVLVDRRGISMRLVAWAALIILLFRPELLLSASFQLSFAAVIGLVAAYEEFQTSRLIRGEDFSVWRRAGVYLIGIALTTAIATVATTPYAAYHFNRMPSYGLVANMVAVPITGLWIMPWGVAALVLMPFGLQVVALEPMSWGVEAVVAVAEAVGNWPGAVVSVPQIATADLILFTIGALWICLWHGTWRWLGLGLISVGFAGVILAVPPDLLVDRSGRLFAVRSADGELLMSSRRAGRFTRQTWARRSGSAISSDNWPTQGVSIDNRLACDKLGCIYSAHGRTVALARSHAALAEDCLRADLIISTVPLRSSCPSAHKVIDRFDLWRNGAHAVWLGDNDIRIESVNGQRGDRPWVLQREKK